MEFGLARLPRNEFEGIPLHIIQRGNNRQICFADEENFQLMPIG